MDRSAIVLGAGLACAAAVRKSGIRASVIERGSRVGMSWRGHYDRLHLHTDRGHSSLPGLDMPKSYPRYPSRTQVIDYLEAYADHQGVWPEFDCEARELTFDGTWRVGTDKGPRRSEIVVVALGVAGFPHRPAWPGAEDFAGRMLHSSEYRNPAAFAGQSVLVVGLGNSGGEIALDLAEAGIDVSLCVRGPVNVIPREVLGIPILTLAIAERRLPLALADMLNRQVSRLAFGNLSRLGLVASRQGPLRQARDRQKIPLIDIGTLRAIGEGRIAVLPGIRAFGRTSAAFVDGQERGFDAVVLATGFRPDLRALLPEHRHLLDDSGAPKRSGAASGEDGLFFCSYVPSPTGQLREIGREARAIANAIAS